jgi:hypothetical protein
MVAFDIRVNGTRLCRPGITADLGVLVASVHWVRSRKQRRGAKSNRIREALQLQIGGLDGSGPHEGFHSNWPSPRLKVGDRIVLSIVETKRVDAPIRRYRLSSKPGD